MMMVMIMTMMNDSNAEYVMILMYLSSCCNLYLLVKFMTPRR